MMITRTVTLDKHKRALELLIPNKLRKTLTFHSAEANVVSLFNRISEFLVSICRESGKERASERARRKRKEKRREEVKM